MGKLGFMTIFENRKEILKIFEYKTMAHFSLLVFKMAQFILESFWEYRIEILKFLVFFFKQFGSFFSFIVKNAFSSSQFFFFILKKTSLSFSTSVIKLKKTVELAHEFELKKKIPKKGKFIIFVSLKFYFLKS